MQSERKEEGAEPRSSTKILWAPYTSRLSQVLPTYVFPQAANWQNKPEGPRRLLEKLITSWMNWSRIQLRYFGVRNDVSRTQRCKASHSCFLHLHRVLPTRYRQYCTSDSTKMVHRRLRLASIQSTVRLVVTLPPWRISSRLNSVAGHVSRSRKRQCNK
jgi:hypothetical protein